MANSPVFEKGDSEEHSPGENSRQIAVEEQNHRRLLEVIAARFGPVIAHLEMRRANIRLTWKAISAAEDRPPRYASRTYYWGTLGALLIAELLLNRSGFELLVPNLPIAAYGIALTFGTLLVTCAVVFGLSILRFRFWQDSVGALGALAPVAGFGAAIVSLTYTSALLRQAFLLSASEGPQNLNPAQQIAIAFGQGLNLVDWGFWLLTLLIACTVALATILCNDPHPDYQKIDRELSRTEKSLSRLRNVLEKATASEYQRHAAVLRRLFSGITGDSPDIARGHSGGGGPRPPPTGGGGPSGPSDLPADASVFAPKQLRRGAAELLSYVIHVPDDRELVSRMARASSPRTAQVGAIHELGQLAVDTRIDVVAIAHGASLERLSIAQIWRGKPLRFDFLITALAEATLMDVTIAAKIIANGAQIGTIAFVRKVQPGETQAASSARVDAKLRPPNRVFLSYSSTDREKAALVAGTYARANIPHFFDRTSLLSGEEWTPKLYLEIDRADLFHLCWSHNAAISDWVKRETEHAMEARRANGDNRPEITIQMFDGPPWAPHPAEWDQLHFDDFLRAAIVGYGSGS